MKRVFDLAIAFGLLIALAPLLAAIGLLIWLRLGRPVLFRQKRPGLKERPFWLYKFRTMRDARDEQGRLLSDEERMTALGRFLRSSSLDELPELWNVLRGEMSLVGPRPLLMAFLDEYTPRQRKRHDVRPGITGWAQIHGRNNLSWEEKLALDVWYVEHATLWLDLWVLWKTVGLVLSRRGVEISAHCLPPRLSSLSVGEILQRGDGIS